jgi:hypothetical protein
MSETKLVTKKLVTVRCHSPFRIGHIPFAGVCNKVTLSVEDISKCIEHKALVVEHLKNGQEVPLGFDNYNTYNGPTIIDNDSPVTEFAEPVIERIVDGKVSLVNQVEKKVEEEPKKVITIDLESINKKKEEEKAKAEEEKKIQEVKDAKKAKEEKQKEDQKQRDEEERKRALDAVLEREKEASDRKNADSGVVEISIKKSEDVVAEKETVAEIPGTVQVEVNTQEPVTMTVPGVAGDNAEVNTPDVFKDDNNQQQNNSKKDKKNKHH